MITAILAGSFDPFTLGHLDLVERSLTFCDNLIIAIGTNSTKNNTFSFLTKKKMIELSCASLKGVSIGLFDNLLVNYAQKNNAQLLIRGVRSTTDFEYEMNLASINKELAPEIETIFIPTKHNLAIVSSSMVRELLKYKQDISRFVPKEISEYIKTEINKPQFFPFDGVKT